MTLLLLLLKNVKETIMILTTILFTYKKKLIQSFTYYVAFKQLFILRIIYIIVKPTYKILKIN